MTDTHALGSIEPVAWQTQRYQRGMWVETNLHLDEPTATDDLVVIPLYALAADYLERVRAMEAETDRLKAENETLLEALCDGQLVLDPNAETQWWKHYKHLTERAALSNREDGDV